MSHAKDDATSNKDKENKGEQELERTASKNVLLNPYYQPEEDIEMEKYVKENNIDYQQDASAQQEREAECDEEDENVDQHDRRHSVPTEHEEIVNPEPPRKKCEIPWGSIIGLVVLVAFIVLIVIAAT